MNKHRSEDTTTELEVPSDVYRLVTLARQVRAKTWQLLPAAKKVKGMGNNYLVVDR